MEQKRLNPETEAALGAVLDYLHEEERHFVESGKPRKHIYRHIRKIREWLDGPEDEGPD